MASQEKLVVPEGFKKLVAKRLTELDISLRELARRADISPSFLSRILSGNRGLPDDEDILRLAEELEIEPPRRLLVEARRVPRTGPMVPLMRAASELTQQEIREVLRVARKLAKTRRSKKREGGKK